MAKGFNISIKGLSQELKKLGEDAEDIKEEIDLEILATSVDIVRDSQQFLTNAKAYANGKEYVGVDTGRLRASATQPKKVKPFQYEIVYQSNYAAFVEFGTGNLFTRVEDYWIDVAAQFKGKGIKQINLPPRPFLRPAVKKNEGILIQNINNVLK
jgi:HK97 gp10 family phage protein